MECREDRAGRCRNRQRETSSLNAVRVRQEGAGVCTCREPDPLAVSLPQVVLHRAPVVPTLVRHRPVPAVQRAVDGRSDPAELERPDLFADV